MDASAYLVKHGWRGEGHSLDHSDRGIRRPLLVSKKVDVLGVGLNKHAAVSDQWWLRAFDQGLKALGTRQNTTLAQVQKHGVNRGGLYGRFVKGDNIPGSIGVSTAGTPEDSVSGSSTPKETQQKNRVNMGIDIPLPAKVERTASNHRDQNAHDATKRLLQNADEAPASTNVMQDRKRKRAETPAKKLARRKIERQDKITESTGECHPMNIREGIPDAKEDEEKRRSKELSKRVNEFVLEAQRRGHLPTGHNKIPKHSEVTGANGTLLPSRRENEMQFLFDTLGLTTPKRSDVSRKSGLKGQKFEREKLKREIKRAAKAYLMGDSQLLKQTSVDTNARKAGKKAKDAARGPENDNKKFERMAKREARALKKTKARAKRKVTKEEVTHLTQDDEAAKKAGEGLQVIEQAIAIRNDGNPSNEFSAGIDEIKLDPSSEGSPKEVNDTGASTCYSTKAEKRARKLPATATTQEISLNEPKARLEADAADKLAAERENIDRHRAKKRGMSLEEYRGALIRGEVSRSRIEETRLPPEKLAIYTERAQAKSMSLEEYIRRREEKYIAKQAEKIGDPVQHSSFTQPSITDGSHVDVPSPEECLGFVVDTVGDSHITPNNFSVEATATMKQDQTSMNIDPVDNKILKQHPNMVDPRLWAGQNVKDLSKPLRKARQQWMKAKREAKKSHEGYGSSERDKKKDKGQRKIEMRETLVRQVLSESRKALREGNRPNVATIDGIVDVPLVKIETKNGIYRKEEVALARRVARRALKNVKHAQKAEKGKTKGPKNR